MSFSGSSTHPLAAQTRQRLEVEVRIQELKKKAEALEEEIGRLLPHLLDTHLFEDVKQFYERAWRLGLHCTSCHFSLLKGYKIDGGHVAELEAQYEAVRREWDDFALKNRLLVARL
jgi:hypothetical protein